MASNKPQDLEISIQKLLHTDNPCCCDEAQVDFATSFPEHNDNGHENPTLYQDLLVLADQTRQAIQLYPYGLPLYIILAQHYSRLAYPDLAAGAAYKALLLSDAIQSEEDEYHELAVTQCLELIAQSTSKKKFEASVTTFGENRGYNDAADGASRLDAVLKQRYMPEIYRLLASSLHSCECYQSAFIYSSQGSRLFPADPLLPEISSKIQQDVARKLEVDVTVVESGEYSNPSIWPDQGFVRRERYPWNIYEPTRLDELSTLNAMMEAVAPKLEVLAVELPDLTTNTSKQSTSVKQLGVFAREDISPGEDILIEKTLLTANNKLQDALCDACSADLPELNSSSANEVVSCPDCDVVFCSESCMESALEVYHPAVCDTDVEGIAKDVPSAQAADALYSLLLLRTLAMAETQQCHPLELKEVKYIWGDFHNAAVESMTEAQTVVKTLPFSFENNVRLPFHMLEKMDIDIYANPQHDVWVFNSLYAKFRGTASARLSGLGGRPARGPEVSAVHPMWCLANHSCDPNVTWDWGGSITFRARNHRKTWQNMSGETKTAREPGIKKGEEVLNHYCDVDLPVNDRREWAKGSLGGDCRCERCIWEANDRV